jgi:hypothetical protein
MNERLVQLYRACKPKEALASQDQYNTANVLLGSEVAKFAELILFECIKIAAFKGDSATGKEIKEHFGVK